jgi:hypothetical protein
VQDAAVPAAGVEPARGLLFQDGDAASRTPALELERQRDPDNAAADNEKISGLLDGVQACATLGAERKSSRRRRGVASDCLNAWTL